MLYALLCHLCLFYQKAIHFVDHLEEISMVCLIPHFRFVVRNTFGGATPTGEIVASSELFSFLCPLLEMKDRVNDHFVSAQ